MAKDVAILADSVDANDDQQIVLDQSEISRPLPWLINDAMLLVRFSMVGTSNYAANAIQMGFWSTENSGVSPMTGINAGGTVEHSWGCYHGGAGTYVAGSPDYWNGGDNGWGRKIQAGSNTNISFFTNFNKRFLTGDNTRQIMGFRMVSSGPTDASTFPIPIFYAATTNVDIDDAAWASAKEGIFPAGYHFVTGNQSSRNDPTYGVLDRAYVSFNDPNNQIKIHDLSVTKFS